MKKRTVIILTLTIALLFGGCKHQAETSMSALFPSEINSIEVTFDIYPSETTRALNIDEITAVTEWVLALEMEQAPLDETETPSNYAGGVAWHFNVNSGDLTFSYADYDESAIFINDEWYALKNPSNPPIEESTEDEVVEFHGQLFHKSDLTEETLECHAREAFSYYAAQRQAGNIPPAWRGCRRTAGATTHYAQKSRAVSKFSQ